VLDAATNTGITTAAVGSAPVALGKFIGGGAAAPGTQPTITTASPLPAGTVGIPYSQSISATGTAPITFSLIVGALPAGLTLNTSTGAITGTPTTAGTFNFTITATNSFGTDADPFALTISAGGVPPPLPPVAQIPRCRNGL